MYRPGKWDKEILEGEIDPEYYSLPKNLRVLVDIGAHIGGTSILAASMGAVVHAYEPDPENYHYLARNVRLNDVKVQTFKKAVSGKKGMATLERNDINTGGYGFYAKGTSLKEGVHEDEVEVDTVTLHDVLIDLGEVDVLKMDCEGAEYDILLECDPKLFKKIKQISMELHFSGTFFSKRIAAKHGDDYETKLVTYLKNFYDMQEFPSSARSARSLIFTRHE